MRVSRVRMIRMAMVMVMIVVIVIMFVIQMTVRRLGRFWRAASFPCAVVYTLQQARIIVKTTSWLPGNAVESHSCFTTIVVVILV